MLGFNVKINALKAEPTRELLLQVKALGNYESKCAIVASIAGDSVGYIDHAHEMPFPMHGPIPLLQDVDYRDLDDSSETVRDIVQDSSKGQMLVSGAYPTLFTALGSDILLGFAEKHAEKLLEVIPSELYLVEMWDLS